MLHDLIPTFEAAYGEQWASLSEAYRNACSATSSDSRFPLPKLEAKFKLSQNRTKPKSSKT